MKRIAIISTHPIQYNAPFFSLLAKQDDLEVKVFYTWKQAEEKVYDPGFNIERKWDIPLLEGYQYDFLENTSSNPGTHHFWGIVNPESITAISKFDPDALLVYGWSNYSHLRIMCYFHSSKLILFKGDSTLLDEPSGLSIKKTLRRFILTWVYSHIHIALYVGQANKQYFLKHKVLESNLVHAPHSIENERFEANSEHLEDKANEWRKQLNITPDELVFLFAGKLEPKKNPQLLIEAFKELNNVNIHLIIVGNGKQEAKLKLLATKDDRIIFLPFQNQTKMPIVYRLGNILILPSKGPGETWGLAINEAFACARPAIVSNKVGCGQDLIVEDQTGWVFDYSDAKSLTQCLEKALFRGKSGLAQMGNFAQQKIQHWNYVENLNAIKQALTIS